MTEPANHHPKPRRGRKPQDAATIAKPSWADDLRKLYDDVVAEPLPDSFEELLRKLDQDGNG
ncbi:MAG: NepR family anti-sigma factor [Novosphingobium sp.]